jgi:hypothetical protein
MRKLLVGAVACGLTMGALGVSTAAAPQSYETSINQSLAAKSPHGYVVGGTLEVKGKKKCRSNREMSLVETQPMMMKRNPGDVLDTVNSSDNGAWLMQVEKKTFDVKIKVEKKTLSNGDVCKGASQHILL